MPRTSAIDAGPETGYPVESERTDGPAESSFSLHPGAKRARRPTVAVRTGNRVALPATGVGVGAVEIVDAVEAVRASADTHRARAGRDGEKAAATELPPD